MKDDFLSKNFILKKLMRML